MRSSGPSSNGLERQIAELRQQVQDLKPASTRTPPTLQAAVDRPDRRQAEAPEPPSKKRRGGQKGHPRRMRALVPPERVASVTDCKPTRMPPLRARR